MGLTAKIVDKSAKRQRDSTPTEGENSLAFIHCLTERTICDLTSWNFMRSQFARGVAAFGHNKIGYANVARARHLRIPKRRTGAERRVRTIRAASHNAHWYNHGEAACSFGSFGRKDIWLLQATSSPPWRSVRPHKPSPNRSG